ncbi:hypothetical protein CIPAW_01G167500 [Carya illinoinensis]|nr:hypothetical protein CIPAW_01G167500 [Carya illinoinensis]
MYSATGRLNLLSQISLSGVTAALFGLWRCGQRFDSWVDRVFARTGDRMQFELAKIILTKYQHDPWRMKLISKHFYPEEVFDDTDPDQPKQLWRYRNRSNDFIRGQSAHESDSPSYSKKNGQHIIWRFCLKPTIEVPKNGFSSVATEVLGNPGIDLMENPFDCVFGNLALRDEIRIPSTSSIPPGTHARDHKRSHRRRRMRRQDVPINSQHLG